MGISRRGFVISSGLVGGALFLGVAARHPSPQRTANSTTAGSSDHFLTAWIELKPSGQTTILIPHSEMGQGVHTSLAMMAADEMDADWSNVMVQQAPVDQLFSVANRFDVRDGNVERFVKGLLETAGLREGNQPSQFTGTSASVRLTGELLMRTAGASARSLLIEAAASHWSISQERCRAAKGYVYRKDSGQKLAYGDLAESASKLNTVNDPPLKIPAQFTLMGKPIQRIDIPQKVTGAAMFAMDVRPDKLLFAAIRMAPVFGSKLVSVDASRISNPEGLIQVLELEEAVVVVADNSWRAEKMAQELQPQFNETEASSASSTQLDAQYQHALQSSNGELIYSQGNAVEPKPGLQTYEATYRVPFLAHASMEPINCTAHFDRGRVIVWGGFQDPLALKSQIASWFGKEPADVIIYPTYLGSAFGRHLPVSIGYVRYAVLVAQHFDQPVQTLFSREQDLRHDCYRPKVNSKFSAIFDDDGSLVQWHNRFTGQVEQPDAAIINYNIPNQIIESVPVQTHLPLGNWRSVDHSFHGFFIESFIDELANELGQDPLAYRLRLLEGRNKHQSVLQTVAQLAGYNPDSSTAYGIAMHECYGSVVGMIVAMSTRSMNPHGIEKIYCVVDCGRVINPQIAEAQVEGGILFGLCAALFGKITVDNGQIAESNFDDYKVISLQDSPPIEIKFIESLSLPGGLGEVGTPPVAPALANAIFRLRRERIRELPIYKD